MSESRRGAAERVLENFHRLRPSALAPSCSAADAAVVAGRNRVVCDGARRFAAALRRKRRGEGCAERRRFLHFDWGYGRGWNNFLFSLYRGAAIATQLGRTLVLPPLASFLGCNNCDPLAPPAAAYPQLGCVLNLTRVLAHIDAVPYEVWLDECAASPDEILSATSGAGVRYFSGSPRREHAMRALGLDALLRRSAAREVRSLHTEALPYFWLQERIAGVDVPRLRADCEACTQSFGAIHPFAARKGLRALDLATLLGGEARTTLWFGDTMHALNWEDEDFFLHIRCAFRPLDQYLTAATRVMEELVRSGDVVGAWEELDGARSARSSPRGGGARVVAVHQRRGDKRDDCFREIAQSAACRASCVAHCAQSAADVAAAVMRVDAESVGASARAVDGSARPPPLLTVVLLITDRDFASRSHPPPQRDRRFVQDLRALLPSSSHRLLLSSDLHRAAQPLWRGAGLGDLATADMGSSGGGGAGGAAYMLDSSLARLADAFIGMPFSTVSLNIALQRRCDGTSMTSASFF